MILVSVGASNFKFDRLFRILDELCEEKIINSDDIIAQTGIIDYKIKHFRHFDYISPSEMNKYQEQANLVISHAGTGTVIGCLYKNKKIIVFPRLADFNEHESNHQLDLAYAFSDNGYILLATNKQELIEAIDKIDIFQPSKFVSNTGNFINMIEKLID